MKTDLDREFARCLDATDRALAEIPVPAFEGVRRSYRRRSAMLAFAATVIVVGVPAVLGILPGPESDPVTDLPVIPDTGITVVTAPDTGVAPDGAVFVWTRIEDPALGGEGTQAISTMTHTPDGLLAGGHDGSDAAVWTSVDGREWHRVADEAGVFGSGSSPFGAQGRRTIGGFASLGTRTIAFGTECGDFSKPVVVCFGVVWITDDGETWDRTTTHDGAMPITGEWVWWGEWEGDFAAGRIGMTAAATTDLGFVVVGDGIWTSPNGLEWDRQEMVGTDLFDILATDDGLLLVGEDDGSAAAWKSQYGRVWQPATVEMGSDAGVGLASTRFSSVVAVDNGFVAVGSHARDYGFDVAFWQSADGADWNLTRIGTWGLHEDMNGVVAIGSTVIAVGSEAYTGGRAAVWTSGDGGLTWIKVPNTDGVFGHFDSEQFPSGAHTVITVDDRIVVGGHNAGDAGVWIAERQP